MSFIIETYNLTKKFGKFTAVDDVSLCVKKGEIYGFLGLNGAGKTTTIKMLLGMIRPSKGSASIDGVPIRRGGKGPWQKVGNLVEMPYAYPELSVRENLEIFRRLRNIGGASNTASIIKIMDRLKLSRYAQKKAGQLSLGNLQRLGLAKALMHDPEVLILDEPANGLDPAGIVEIRELFFDLTQNHGVTIFVSSHILGEISRMASRIGIIHDGRLLQELEAGELGRLRKKQLMIQTRDNVSAFEILTGKGYFPVLRTKPKGGINSRNLHSPSANHTLNEETDCITLTDPAAMNAPDEVARLLVQSGNPPVALYVKEEDLENYFLRIIQGNK